MRAFLSLLVLTMLVATLAPLAVAQEGDLLIGVRANSDPSPEYDVATINTDGTGMTVLLDANMYCHGMRWSPDRTQIAFSARAASESINELYRVDSSGANLVQVTNWGGNEGNGGQRYPVYFDESEVVFSRFHTDVIEPYLIDTSGMDSLRLSTEGEEFIITDIKDSLVVFQFRATGSFDDAEIYVAHFNDLDMPSNWTQLTDDSQRDNWPRFSPDGSKIAYGKGIHATYHQNVFVYDLQTSTEIPITNSTNQDSSFSHPVWSPCGNWIACNRTLNDQNDVAILSVSGDSLRLVTNSPDSNEVVWDWRGQAPVSAGQLSFPSIALHQCEPECVYQPIVLVCEDTINTLSIPVQVPEGVSICVMSTEGCITDSWLNYSFDHSTDSGFIHFALVDNSGAVLEPGEHTVAYIGFTKDDLVCGESGVVSWDTTLMGDNFRELATVNTAGQIRYPVFDATIDSSTITKLMAGDNNGDCAVNISDLTGMTEYMFAGAQVDFPDMIDVNGDCAQNISDLTNFVAYLFDSGPAPACPCSNPAPAPKLTASTGLCAEYANGSTILTLSSEVHLSGLEVHLQGNGSAEPVSLADANLELVHGHADGLLKLGLLDLQGAQMIEAGDRQIVEIPGEYEIVHALGSSLDHRPVGINLATSLSAPVVPQSFALHQNYPNPFNPVTTISFESPDAADYTLTVYNTLGQVVECFEGVAQAGENSVTWDASSNSSGVYFYKLEIGNNTDTKKMMLLK